MEEKAKDFELLLPASGGWFQSCLLYTSNYGSVKIVYGGLNAWLRSRHSGGSVPACAVEINGGLVNYDASLSCSVRPAIILNP